MKSCIFTLHHLCYGAECDFEAGLRHVMTGKLSLSAQQKMGTIFKLGKDRQQKVRDRLCLSSTVPKIQ